jgi:transcriptional regulator with XRE-family HTH domain
MEKKKIHVGELVKEYVKQHDESFAEIARKIGVSRQTLNGWLRKDDWSVKDLFTISSVVNHDFVKSFCLPEETEQETKIILHIEVGKDKIGEVLKVIKDKQLYNILRK